MRKYPSNPADSTACPSLRMALCALLGAWMLLIAAGCGTTAKPEDYKALYFDRLAKYNELAETYNAEANKLRHLEREYHIFRDQLVMAQPASPFQEAVRTELLVRLYGAEHYSLRTPESPGSVFHKFRQVENFAGFVKWVDQNFHRQSNTLTASWGVHDAGMLRAFYYAWIVSCLWGPGGSDQYNQPGCIIEGTVVERADFRPESVTFELYQKSNLACCTDYALFLKLMLDHASIRNRVVCLKGHIANEVFLQGRWWTLDAMAGFAVDVSREQLNTGQVYPGAGLDNLKSGYQLVYWFPHPAMQETSPVYRPVAGALRVFYLLESLRGNLELEKTLEGDAYYEFLPYGNVVKAFLPSSAQPETALSGPR